MLRNASFKISFIYQLIIMIMARKGPTMYILLFLILVSQRSIFVEALTKCCPNENIVINEICSDGSNITVLSCEIKNPVGPSINPSVSIAVEEDDTLTITDIYDIGRIVVDPSKYCMTKESENGTDIAIVCYEEEMQPSSGERIVTAYLRIVCSLISSIFLFITFMIYLFTRDLQDLEGKCILHFLTPLLIAHIMLTFESVILYINSAACDTVFFINYASALCCYNWLSVMAFHVWRITIRPIFQAHMHWFIAYHCYGFGVPLLLILTALIHHYTQDINPTTAEIDCWMSGGLAIWTYFFAPIIIMLVVASVFLIWTAKKLWIDIDRRDYSQSVVRLRKKCLTCTYLLLITGSVAILDMIYGTFVTITDEFSNYIWDISDCRNLLMGVAVFCVLIVMRAKVLKTLAKRGLFCMKFPQSWSKFVDEEREELENEEATLTQYSSGL